jgi:lipoprotein-anchoring transpeptidase ErfK/SrfK
VDTLSRNIYIHGTNAEQALGTPASRGCIRLANRDILELFEVAGVGTRVWIGPDTAAGWEGHRPTA